MNVEVKEGRLIVTPDKLDEERKLFALAAAYKAYEAVMLPICGEPLHYNEGDNTESNSPRQNPKLEDLLPYK